MKSARDRAKGFCNFGRGIEQPVNDVARLIREVRLEVLDAIPEYTMRVETVYPTGRTRTEQGIQLLRAEIERDGQPKEMLLKDVPNGGKFKCPMWQGTDIDYHIKTKITRINPYKNDIIIAFVVYARDKDGSIGWDKSETRVILVDN